MDISFLCACTMQIVNSYTIGIPNTQVIYCPFNLTKNQIKALDENNIIYGITSNKSQDEIVISKNFNSSNLDDEFHKWLQCNKVDI